MPSDYGSIAVAAQVATDGDTILVACGTYLEHSISIPRGVTILGAGGSGCVIIDAQERGRIFSGSMTLVGLTLVHGLPQGPGGAVLGSGVILNCTFEGNNTNTNQQTYDGGAVSGSFAISSSTFRGNGASGYGGAIAGCSATDCVFVNNGSAREWGGAAYNGGPYVSCRFEANHAQSGGHAVYVKYWGGRIEGCEFTQHSRPGGVIKSFQSSPTIAYSTFWDNDGDKILYFVAESGHSPITAEVENCTIYGENVAVSAFGNTQGSISVVVANTILAYNSIAMQGSVTATCCDLWQNGGKSSEQQDGNIAADPRFCDAAHGVFTLDAESPCLPEDGNACGLIGAHESGCGLVLTPEKTLGGLKGLFR